ncbi:MAG: ATP-binding protein [Pseudanabaena sp. SU_2_4]|nr:ATP-binding protein [Pseudanabaena sp. SU_2_4]
MTKTIQLQVKTDLNELVEVLAWFNQLYQDSIPKIDWLKCQTALAEAFTNVVRHAHKDRSLETPIELEAALSSDYLEIRIWDYGPQFDLEYKVSILPSEVDETATGGRGLYLLKQIADGISYTRDGDRNCLLLVKKFSPVA